jgi:CHAT domain-containing protein
MLVLGGIDYEHFPAPVPAQSAAAAPATPAAASAAAPPAADPTPLLRAMNARLRAARGGFTSLPHTDPEATEVGNYFWDYYSRKAEVLKARAAAEARLKTLTRPPRLLHLATHGFFLPRQAAAEGGATDLGVDRALTLAGLALAGANQGLAGKTGPDDEDGILYALEAQDLNLEGTELVALSACDTGQGRVDVSEGVYGLVRAFQIAGARHVLMTQWALNDPAARAFMGAFYKRWLEPNAFAHPADALRATQLDWLTSDDPVKADPRFWAPYVLIEQG